MVATLLTVFLLKTFLNSPNPWSLWPRQTPTVMSPTRPSLFSDRSRVDLLWTNLWVMWTGPLYQTHRCFSIYSSLPEACPPGRAVDLPGHISHRCTYPHPPSQGVAPGTCHNVYDLNELWNKFCLFQARFWRWRSMLQVILLRPVISWNIAHVTTYQVLHNLSSSPLETESL